MKLFWPRPIIAKNTSMHAPHLSTDTRLSATPAFCQMCMQRMWKLLDAAVIEPWTPTASTYEIFNLGRRLYVYIVSPCATYLSMVSMREDVLRSSSIIEESWRLHQLLYTGVWWCARETAIKQNTHSLITCYNSYVQFTVETLFCRR